MGRTFNGTSSDYLRVEASPITVKPITMACWFRTTSIATGTRTLVHVGDKDTTNNYWTLANRTDTVRFAVQAGATNINTQGSGEITTGTWYHAAGIETGTSRTAYVNGALIATGATTAAAPSGVDRISAAVQDTSSPAGFHGGDIAEIGVWSSALNTTELALLAAGYPPSAVSPSTLVFYAPLYGAASPEPDYTANANNFTVNGTTAGPHPFINIPQPVCASPVAP